MKPEESPSLLAAAQAGDGFTIRRSPNDKGNLFHHRRQLDDGELLLLVNTSIESPGTGEVTSFLSGVEQWNPETGAVLPYPFDGSRWAEARVPLPPCGSLLLFLSGSGASRQHAAGQDGNDGPEARQRSVASSRTC